MFPRVGRQPWSLLFSPTARADPAAGGDGAELRRRWSAGPPFTHAEPAKAERGAFTQPRLILQGPSVRRGAALHLLPAKFSEWRYHFLHGAHLVQRLRRGKAELQKRSQAGRRQRPNR